jgi:hypothetical protein
MGQSCVGFNDDFFEQQVGVYAIVCGVYLVVLAEVWREMLGAHFTHCGVFWVG